MLALIAILGIGVVICAKVVPTPTPLNDDKFLTTEQAGIAKIIYLLMK
jgi:hypothetical protein